MGFYKKRQQKINGKWYPQSVTVGKPVTTDQVADRLAQISTVSRADAYAVLKDLASVMADYMGNGRTVKLDGMGTFYYTITATGKGVDTPEKVNASQITGVRVRFIPEATRSTGASQMTRSLVDSNIFWQEWGGTGESTDTDTDGGGDGGGGVDPTE